MIKIPLTQNKVALVDDADFALVNQFRWCAVLSQLKSRELFYASAWIDGKNQYMHRIIMGAKNGEEIDHVNGNGLDNRKSNLKVGTHRQNQVNRMKKHSSKYPGVFWQPRKNPWRARARVNNKNRNFGSHPTQEKAFKAYQEGIYELTGEWVSRRDRSE